MRKMSTYAKKMLRSPEKGRYNGAEFFNTLQRCRPYSHEPMPGSWTGGTQQVAEGVLKNIRNALEQLKDGKVKPDDCEPFDLLAHAVGVALVRTHHTGGDKSPAYEVLGLAKIALESIKARWTRIGKFGATRVEQIAIDDAIDLYETILLSSSPAQMAQATHQRLAILKANGWVEPESVTN